MYFAPLKQIELEFETTGSNDRRDFVPVQQFNELTKWRENLENLVPNVKAADSYLLQIRYSPALCVVFFNYAGKKRAQSGGERRIETQGHVQAQS